jgi:hypothetical protein
MSQNEDLKLRVNVPDDYGQALKRNFGSAATSPQFLPCAQLHPFEKSCVKRYAWAIVFAPSLFVFIAFACVAIVFFLVYPNPFSRPAKWFTFWTNCLSLPSSPSLRTFSLAYSSTTLHCSNGTPTWTAFVLLFSLHRI